VKEVKRQVENALNATVRRIGKMGLGRLILVWFNASFAVIAVSGSAKNLIFQLKRIEVANYALN
jgi:hypothetical protein